MNSKTIIYNDVKERFEDLNHYVKKQAMIYDVTSRELYKYLIILSRKEMRKYE